MKNHINYQCVFVQGIWGTTSPIHHLETEKNTPSLRDPGQLAHLIHTEESDHAIHLTRGTMVAATLQHLNISKLRKKQNSEKKKKTS